MMNIGRNDFVQVVRNARKNHIKNDEIINFAIEKVSPLLSSNSPEITKYIKQTFLLMLDMYDQAEKEMAFRLLYPVYSKLLKNFNNTENNLTDLLKEVYLYDYDLHNSAAQSRRSSRGRFLESIFYSLFERFSSEGFISQARIIHGGMEKKIDFILGTRDINNLDAALYITVKKSLRERGPQISDEKRFLNTNVLFFFNSDAKKISHGNMLKFYSEDVVIVTYTDLVDKFYREYKHVVSYDKFFLEMLPQFNINKDKFDICNFDIETKNNKSIKMKEHANL